MPTRLDTNFARPRDHDEFESLIRDICALEWGDPNTRRFGRKGQRQFGVDVYGLPTDLEGVYRGVQCKLRTKDDTLSEAEISNEVKAARAFPHDLDKLIIATDAPRDTHTQVLVDLISQEENRNYGRQVTIWSWDEITARLAAYPGLIVKYYADYFANLSSLPVVEQLIDSPLSVVFASPLSTPTVSRFRQELVFRGIRLLDHPISAPLPLRGSDPSHATPDGYVCHLSLADVSEDEALPIRKMFVNHVGFLAQQKPPDCSFAVVVPEALLQEVKHELEALGVHLQSIDLVPGEADLNEVARQIFTKIFDFGYARRGALPTINVTIRSVPNRPDSALLDMDWQAKLDIRGYPSPAEWHELFIPSLLTVVKTLTALPNKTCIQIESRLPIPAALAVGYFLNLRVARLGVWARTAGVSDFKHQFWHSDGKPADDALASLWVRKPEEESAQAVLELSTSVSLHSSVKE